MKRINFLKQLGHELLEEFIALDIASKSNDKTKRNNAYTKLQEHLHSSHYAHYSMMTTEPEVWEANNTLKKLIAERKAKIYKLGLDKVVIAPNVQELQKFASTLNQDILSR